MKINNFLSKIADKCKAQFYEYPSAFIIKTSESIGTLNSNDDQTDRSFIIKDNSLMSGERRSARGWKISGMKDDNELEVEHLKQLCSSQRQHQQDHQYITHSDLHTSSSKKSKYSSIDEWMPSQTPFFSKFMKLLSGHKFTTNLNQMQQIDNCQTTEQKPFNDYPQKQNEEENECLYEEAPSKLYFSQQNVTPLMKNMELYYEQFCSQYGSLIQRISHLKQCNFQLQEACLKNQHMSLQYERVIHQLQEDIGELKSSVSSTIQENVKIENILKQVLLQNEMEKFRRFNKRDSYENDIDDKQNGPISTSKSRTHNLMQRMNLRAEKY